MAIPRQETDASFVEGVAVLSRLLLPAARVSQALETVVRLAPRTVAGCDLASVSLLGDAATMTTAAASEEPARVLDLLQVETDEGPCIDAIRTGSRVIVAAFGEDGRYPAFGAVASDTAGVHSCFSLPLLATRRVTGSLNLYGKEPNAYDERGDVTAVQLAEQAALIVATALAHERSTRLAGQLQATLASRAVIEQAKGILMARSRVAADEAFDILRRASQRQNVKLREVARQIVENVQEAPSADRP
jgi:transcriptional regulator with GAF, ATPase, and Fis domain